MKWIALKDQKPTRWQQVIVAAGATVPRSLMTWDGERFTVGITDQQYRENAEVTHWMALPESPNEPYDASRFCGPPSFCDCAKAMKARGDDIVTPRNSAVPSEDSGNGG